MSQCIVPNWDLSHQIKPRPLQSEEEEESNRYCNHLVMPIYEAMALTWPNQELLLAPSTKHSWDVNVETNDTLESMVRMATTSDKQSKNLVQQGHTLLADIGCARKCVHGSSQEQEPTATTATQSRKRPTWSNQECYQSNRNTTTNSNNMHAGNEINGDFSTACRDMDTTLMTWPSLESPQSFKTNYTDEVLAPPYASEEEHNIKRKTDGCRSTKRTRAATTHNQTERRRRDRINQRLKDLKKLVPNGSKNDTASLLDDTIQYLKQLQADVQLMYSIRTMPHMIMALGMQQQQMSLLARMGMGVGMLDSDSMARVQSITHLLHPTSAAFAPPPALVPSMIPTTQAKAKLPTGASVLPADPFSTFPAQQSMNMDLYSKMVTLYCQEVNRTQQQTDKSSQSRRVEGGNALASRKKL